MCSKVVDAGSFVLTSPIPPLFRISYSMATVTRVLLWLLRLRVDGSQCQLFTTVCRGSATWRKLAADESLGEGESKAEESETVPQDRLSLSAHAGTSEQFSE